VIGMSRAGYEAIGWASLFNRIFSSGINSLNSCSSTKDVVFWNAADMSHGNIVYVRKSI
jgi:hypothetical protein